MIETGSTGEKPTKLRTNAWGIDANYQDAYGQWHDTPEHTITAILEAMGADPTALGPPAAEPVIIVRHGEQRELAGTGEVVLESGETLGVSMRLPADLPTGYHSLQTGDAPPVPLIVSPGRCWLPESLHTWGWAVQLYSARSRNSWGIGDLGDLRDLCEWSARAGAGMLLVNPLSAPSPTKPQQSSPYYPSSRRFFNPLWLRIELIPGATSEVVPNLDELVQAGRELNANRLINRDAVFELKMHALEALWLRFEGDPLFDSFCARWGKDLDDFATFSTVAEEYNSGWHSWPAAYQHPETPALCAFRGEKRDRVNFHKWVQWQLDRQLAACSEHLGIMQDLPIGVDPDGADAWSWQELYASGVAVGAPPDEFNTQGQNWGLPPWIPHKLRAVGYNPFIQTVRAAFRHAGGLRVDHVMGLFRLFWIPANFGAADGAYVRYNADEMLAILALESQRAGAYIVGEDLGTLEDGVREKLSDANILSYRLLWFEKDPPAAYPKEALAAVTTHDLPTVCGLWTGSDLERQRKLNLKPNEESTQETVGRLAQMTGLDKSSSPAAVVEGAYRRLAQAPCRIVTAALEDAALVEERPNVPATMPEQSPNWSLALPQPLEELIGAEMPTRISSVLSGRIT